MTAPGLFGTCFASEARISAENGTFPRFPTNRKPQPTKTMPLGCSIGSLFSGALVAPARRASGAGGAA